MAATEAIDEFNRKAVVSRKLQEAKTAEQRKLMAAQQKQRLIQLQNKKDGLSQSKCPPTEKEGRKRLRFGYIQTKKG